MEKYLKENNNKAYIRTYGCQMNEYDSEIIAGILKSADIGITDNPEEADVILLNGCAVRENAETRVLAHVSEMAKYKKSRPEVKIGVLGCMAQHLGNGIKKHRPIVDFILGPDTYKALPSLLFNFQPEEINGYSHLGDYDDITPVRKKGIAAWVAISRGCDENCSYCVVPMTRGSERSRPVSSIIREVEGLVAEGFKEVTLLGQNVNSYRYGDTDFPHLLERLSKVSGIIRVRFATSHPKNMSEELIKVMRDQPKVCCNLHLPFQSGSNYVLERMQRNYTIEHYRELVSAARREIPGLTLTTDIIAGFPGETESDHQKTIHLVESVRFDSAFIFRYSPRSGTSALELDDDVPEEVKISRLQDIISVQRRISEEKNMSMIGERELILIDGLSRRSQDDMVGRTDGNKKVIIPADSLSPGDMVTVTITGATSQTLRGEIMHCS